MIIEIVFTVIASLCIILGLIGCVAPILPGPILSFSGLLIISIMSKFTLYSPILLIILGSTALASQILDNLFPLISSKNAGASKWGIWGSLLGMLVGFLFFPPLGIIFGAFIGAYLGEILFNKENENPLKAAFGILTGTLIGIVLKLIISGIITVYFLSKITMLFS